MRLLLRLHVEWSHTFSVVAWLLVTKFQRIVCFYILSFDEMHLMSFWLKLNIIWWVHVDKPWGLLSLPLHLGDCFKFLTLMLGVRLVGLDLGPVLFFILIVRFIGQVLPPVGWFNFILIALAERWPSGVLWAVTRNRRSTLVPELPLLLWVLRRRLILLVGFVFLERRLKLIFVLVHHWRSELLNFEPV